MEKRGYIHPDWTKNTDPDVKPGDEKSVVDALDNDLTKQAAEKIANKIDVQNPNRKQQ